MNRRFPFEAEWFRGLLLKEVLPRWLDRAVTDEGLFIPQLDRQWRRYGEAFGTVVSQTRLLYNFAQGYRLTNHPAYVQAVEAGTRFLLSKFRDPVYGGWFHAVGPGGRIVDDYKDAYDHAFIIFGLAHAYRVTSNQAARAAMMEAWELLQNRFADGQGGLIRRMTRDFRENEERRTQNPIMHLFEALLAAGEVEPEMTRHAERTAEFALARLVRRELEPCLPEYYTKDWRELPASQGGCISIGHQFEWAFLLSSAVERGLPAEWLQEAEALLNFGLKYGYDASDGGVITSTTREGTPLSRSKGWWEQCECVRALMHHAVVRGRSSLIGHLARTLDFVRARYIDPVYGGWYENIETPPDASRPAKGGPFKVDYHLVGMCVEAIRLAQIGGASEISV